MSDITNKELADLRRLHEVCSTREPRHGIGCVADDCALSLAARNALPRLLDALEEAWRERDDARAAAINAFVQGTDWLRFQVTGATSFESERDEAAKVAEQRYPYIPRVHLEMLRDAEAQRDAAQAEAECHSKNHDTALDQRDAAIARAEKAEAELQAERDRHRYTVAQRNHVQDEAAHLRKVLARLDRIVVGGDWSNGTEPEEIQPAIEAFDALRAEAADLRSQLERSITRQCYLDREAAQKEAADLRQRLAALVAFNEDELRRTRIMVWPDCDMCRDSTYDHECPDQQANPRWVALRAAIAAAKGEQ